MHPPLPRLKLHGHVGPCSALHFASLDAMAQYGVPMCHPLTSVSPVSPWSVTGRPRGGGGGGGREWYRAAGGGGGGADRQKAPAARAVRPCRRPAPLQPADTGTGTTAAAASAKWSPH